MYLVWALTGRLHPPVQLCIPTMHLWPWSWNCVITSSHLRAMCGVVTRNIQIAHPYVIILWSALWIMAVIAEHAHLLCCNDGRRLRSKAGLPSSQQSLLFEGIPLEHFHEHLASTIQKSPAPGLVDVSSLLKRVATLVISNSFHQPPVNITTTSSDRRACSARKLCLEKANFHVSKISSGHRWATLPEHSQLYSSGAKKKEYFIRSKIIFDNRFSSFLN
jgi:hypothetical protein